MSSKDTKQLDKTYKEIRNLKKRLDSCTAELKVIKENLPTRMYRYVVTETVESERWIDAYSDEDARQQIQDMKNGVIDWDLEQHDAEVTDETLFYCPEIGEGHEEVKI
tara:strand:+ start:404 stop:727 length:324 start_codon:yes stop_codon:yes gene_type:complete